MKKTKFKKSGIPQAPGGKVRSLKRMGFELHTKRSKLKRIFAVFSRLRMMSRQLETNADLIDVAVLPKTNALYSGGQAKVGHD